MSTQSDVVRKFLKPGRETILQFCAFVGMLLLTPLTFCIKYFNKKDYPSRFKNTSALTEPQFAPLRLVFTRSISEIPHLG